MEPKLAKIIEAVEDFRDDMVDLTMQLTAEPSILHDEISVVKLMEDEWTRLSFDPVRVPIDEEKLSRQKGFAPVDWSYDGRENLVAVRPADGDGGKSVLFNGHLDVVPPEPLWL